MWRSGLQVSGPELRVAGCDFRASSLGSWVSNLVFRASGTGFGVTIFRCIDLFHSRIIHSFLGVWVSGVGCASPPAVASDSAPANTRDLQ